MTALPKTRILIAPDAFKGGPSAPKVAAAIASGWSDIRPHDTLTLIPLADGGEGTVAAIAAAHVDATLINLTGITGPNGSPTDATYCRLADGTAVIELASSSGLPKMRPLDPAHATTRGLGEVIAHALTNGATRLVIGLGGSASTDGGMGALYALGLCAYDQHGNHVPDGAMALAAIRRIDTTGLLPPPPGGVQLLTDVSAPLTGPTGAAHVFGPQKGADAAMIATLDAALTHLATLSEGRPDAPGAGAAGGTGYGLATFFGGTIQDGGEAISELTGFTDALALADLVLTGEGSLDASTFTGKVVDTVWRAAATHQLNVVAIAGKVDEVIVATKPGLHAVSTSVVAGSVHTSLKDPLTAIANAARHAARTYAP